MTAVIKAGVGRAHVRALTRPDRPPTTAATAMTSAEAALRIAQDEIVALKASLARARREAETAVNEARDAGRREGADVADRTAEQRLQEIARGVAQAHRHWTERLVEIEALAAVFVREALRRIFDPSADLVDLATRAITRQSQALSGEAVIAIRVSSDDFGDAAALDALRAAGGNVTIVPDATLGSGQCRFDLLLGSREISPMAQWTVLEEFLNRLVRGAAA